MIWLTWRQFRASAITGAVILAAATVYFVTTGLSMHSSYAGDLSTCGTQGDCFDVLNNLRYSYDTVFNLSQLLLIAAPGLVGIFWGAPLIGCELETGTHQLVWNQSITRTRWLAVKLAGVGIASAATAGLLSYLLTWWAAPLDQIDGGRFAATTFATRDLVPVGYAAFAFALGTTAGLFLRRAIPAMAVTLAVFIGLQILVPAVVRPNLLPSTTVSYAVDQTTAQEVGGIYTQGGGDAIFLSDLPVPQGSWILSGTPMENSAGQVVAAHDHLNCFPGIGAGPAGGGAKGAGGPQIQQIVQCLSPFDLHQSVTYQPESHYWPLQWIETGIYLALAALLSGSCFWWIRRRHN